MSQHTGSHKNSCEKYLNESHWPILECINTVSISIQIFSLSQNFELKISQNYFRNICS